MINKSIFSGSTYYFIVRISNYSSLNFHHTSLHSSPGIFPTLEYVAPRKPKHFFFPSWPEGTQCSQRFSRYVRICTHTIPKLFLGGLEVTKDAYRTCSNNILPICTLGQCKKCTNSCCVSAGLHRWNMLWQFWTKSTTKRRKWTMSFKQWS